MAEASKEGGRRETHLTLTPTYRCSLPSAAPTLPAPQRSEERKVRPYLPSPSPGSGSILLSRLVIPFHFYPMWLHMWPRPRETEGRVQERREGKNKKQTVQYLSHGTCIILLSPKLVHRLKRNGTVCSPSSRPG